MTARHCGYVMALEADMREDDAQAVIAALRMIRGVAAVEPITPDPAAVMVAELRAKADALRAVHAALYGVTP